MELREIFQILKRKLFLLIIIIVIATIASFYFTKISGDQYETSSILTVQAGREKTDQYQYGGYYSIQASDLFINTIIGWVKSKNFIAEIYKDSEIDFDDKKLKILGKKIYARKVPPQNIILTVKSKQSQESKNIVEGTVNLIKEKTSQLGLVANSSANFEIISSEPITTIIKPNIKFNILISFITSLIMAIIVIFIIEYWSSTINSIQGMKKIFRNDPIMIRGTKIKRLANPETKEAEKFRFIRSNIVSPGKKDKISLIVGGLNEQNITPLIAANLALSFARSGKKTILIDTCFANPAIHDFFGRQNESGFSEFLFDEENLEKYLQKTEEKNLNIISSGIKLSYASDTIERANIEKILKELEKKADAIVINVPSLNISSEAFPLFALIKKAVLIVKVGKTSIPTANYINGIMEKNNIEKHILVI